jgi:hypothetical protein
MSKFPIYTSISKISFIKQKSKLKDSEWTIKQKNISPNILMSCVNDFLSILKDKRQSLFPFIIHNYESSETILENVINTIDNDFFKDNPKFESIIKGKYILSNSYSDLSTFYFNVLMYGHPLLKIYSDNVQFDNDFLSKYSEYLVEFDYEGFQHLDTLRNHVVVCFYFILKVIFVD